MESTSKKYILVADDDLSTVSYILSIIEELNDNFYPVKAANGLEALNIYLHLRPELIITDMIMPQMDGYDLVIKLLNEDKPPNIWAITCFNFPRICDLQDLLKNQILFKPFDIEDIENIVLRHEFASTTMDQDTSPLQINAPHLIK